MIQKFSAIVQRAIDLEIASQLAIPSGYDG